MAQNKTCGNFSLGSRLTEFNDFSVFFPQHPVSDVRIMNTVYPKLKMRPNATVCAIFSKILLFDK